MMPLSDNLSVIIGASPRIERLRRRMVRGGMRGLGVATSLPGLRRELHAGDHSLVVSCLLLDDVTLRQQRDALRRLLADADSFGAEFRSIGLVPDVGLMPEAAELGCHLYVRDPGDVLQAIDILARDRRRRSDRRIERWSERMPVGGSSWPIAAGSRFGRRFGGDRAACDDPW